MNYVAILICLVLISTDRILLQLFCHYISKYIWIDYNLLLTIENEVFRMQTGRSVVPLPAVNNISNVSYFLFTQTLKQSLLWGTIFMFLVFLIYIISIIILSTTETPLFTLQILIASSIVFLPPHLLIIQFFIPL